MQKALGSNFEVFLPSMPNKYNARYEEWEIWFQKISKHFRDGVILVGHSLGASFLVKYLSKNKVSSKIKATFLAAAPYRSKPPYERDFDPPQNLQGLEKQGGDIFFYHSKDDAIVPFHDFLEYRKHLRNTAFREFKNRGHFNQKQFPELIADIKSLYEQ